MRTLALFLLSPLPTSSEAPAGLHEAPALKRMLSRGRLARYPEETPESLLLQSFGVTRQTDWPVAPYAYLGEGGEPGDHYWLRADPVHLRAERDALVLADAGYFDLDMAAAQQLVHALNVHFPENEVRFFAPAAKRWYARVASNPALVTTPLMSASGRSVDPVLPRGADALSWHRAFNEIQMLMHGHAVNEAREAQGQPTINSVWLWGGGVLQSSLTSPYTHVWGSEPLSRGLAMSAGIAANPLPVDFNNWVREPREGDHLVTIQTDELVTGEAGLASLEQGYFAPLLRAVSARTAGAAHIVFASGLHTFRLHVGAGDLWRFWRNQVPELGHA